jgi:hypothetical protein
VLKALQGPSAETRTVLGGKAQFSLGVACEPIFESGKHKEEYKYWDKAERVYRCRHVMANFLKRVSLNPHELKWQRFAYGGQGDDMNGEASITHNFYRNVTVGRKFVFEEDIFECYLDTTPYYSTGTSFVDIGG